MVKKSVLFPLIPIILAGLFSACHKSPSTFVSAHQPLVVGMDLGYPPVETIDAQGQPAGVSVDLARALGDSLISSMTETAEREKTIAFSDPYLSIGLALLAGNKSGLTGPGDLDRGGRTIAVRQGTTGQVWAQEHLKQARALVLDKESSAVLEVIQGKADGFLYDQMSVWKNHQEHPSETIALLEPVQRESWAVGLRPGDAELRVQVNAFIKAFRASGGFERLGNSYLREQKEAFTKAGIPFYF